MMKVSISKFMQHLSHESDEVGAATKKDHFPLPFIDQSLDKLSGQGFSCFLDGYSGYNQLAIHPDDQEKTTFTCPFSTYAFQRMPFGLLTTCIYNLNSYPN